MAPRSSFPPAPPRHSRPAPPLPPRAPSHRPTTSFRQPRVELERLRDAGLLRRGQGVKHAEDYDRCAVEALGLRERTLGENQR
eukprot:5531522-Prymnesium_polylepis.1